MLLLVLLLSALPSNLDEPAFTRARVHGELSAAAGPHLHPGEVDCAEAPEPAYSYRRGPADGHGNPSFIEQRTTDRRRHDRLLYDDADRLSAWHEVVREQATLLDYDLADNRSALHHLEWPADEPLTANPRGRRYLERVSYEQDTEGNLSAIREQFGEAHRVTTDVAGNITRLGELDLSRDARGRPLRDTYDHAGRRLSSPPWNFVIHEAHYDAQGLLGTQVQARVRKFAPHLPGFQLSRDGRGAWEVALLLPDRSVLAVLDDRGDALQTTLYDPFGDGETESRPNYSYPKGYAGYLHYPADAPIPLMDAGHRIYAPTLGRFLRPDPIPPSLDDPRSLNRYAANFHNPAVYTDPKGAEPISIGVAAGVVIGAVAGAIYSGFQAAQNPDSYQGGLHLPALGHTAAGALITANSALASEAVLGLAGSSTLTVAQQAVGSATASVVGGHLWHVGFHSLFPTLAPAPGLATAGLDAAIGAALPLGFALPSLRRAAPSSAIPAQGELRARVLANLEASRRARESSNFADFAARERVIEAAAQQRQRVLANIEASRRSRLSGDFRTFVRRTEPHRRRRTCFIAGTPVLTPDGLTAIEDLQPGDELTCADPQTRRWTTCEVEERLEHPYAGALIEVVAGGTELTATAHHPFWVAEGHRLGERPLAEDAGDDADASADGRWVQAADLQPGDVLLLREGLAEVEALSRSRGRATVFNLRVSDLETYAVGEAGVLVHNKAVWNENLPPGGGARARKGAGGARLSSLERIDEVPTDAIALQLTENSCGAACGRTILLREGVDVPQMELAERALLDFGTPGINTDELGGALNGYLGREVFQAGSLNATASTAKALARRGPFIALLDPVENLGHFVIVERIERGVVGILDPRGVSYGLRLDDFVGAWADQAKWGQVIFK